MFAGVFWRFLFEFYGRVDIRSWILRVWSKTLVAVNDAFFGALFCIQTETTGFAHLFSFKSLTNDEPSSPSDPALGA